VRRNDEFAVITSDTELTIHIILTSLNTDIQTHIHTDIHRHIETDRQRHIDRQTRRKN